MFRRHLAHNAAELAANPKLLLHRSRESSNALTAYDGCVGAVLAEGHYFVTTPNQRWIPEFSLGCIQLCLREDYYFGPEDPLLWPQPYLATHCHYPLIPTQQDDTVEDIWWYQLDRRDMQPDPADWTGLLYQLSVKLYNRFEIGAQKVLVRVRTAAPPTSQNQVVASCRMSLEKCLSRLKTLTFTQNQLRRTISELQRSFLELLAAVRYMEEFKPVFDGKVPGRWRGVLPVVGALVRDLNVAECYHQAGIPFWLIRPFEEVAKTRVDELCSLQSPLGRMSLVPARRSVTLFEGRADDPEKFISIWKLYRASSTFSTPYENTTAPKAVLIKKSTEGSRRKRHTPYEKKGGKATLRRDKFVEVAHPFWPATRKAWADALANIDRRHPPHNPPALHSSTMYPDPALFIGVGSAERRLQYLTTWLKNRAAFMVRPQLGGQPIPVKQWRTLLNVDSMKKGTDTRASANREVVEKLLESVLEDTMTMDAAAEKKIEWNGTEWTAESSENAALVKEVLWELSELNFRYELFALDVRLTGKERLTQILAAVGNEQDSFYRVSPANVDTGLVSTDMDSRLKRLRSLHELMSEWKVGVEIEPGERLEETVASFYCQCFFDSFGRSPILPRGLV